MRRNIAFTILFIAWLPLLAVLWPFPTVDVAEKYHAFFRPLIEEVKSQAQKMKDEKGIVIEEINELTATVPTVKQLHSQLLRSWFVKLSLFLFGSFTVFYAFKQYKNWKFMLAAASVAYLTLGYSIEWNYVLESEYWLSLWHFATKSNVWSFGAMYRELIFPILHILFITGLVTSMFMHKSDLTSHSAGTR